MREFFVSRGKKEVWDLTRHTDSEFEGLAEGRRLSVLQCRFKALTAVTSPPSNFFLRRNKSRFSRKWIFETQSLSRFVNALSPGSAMVRVERPQNVPISNI
jgi:hypothetical protein